MATFAPAPGLLVATTLQATNQAVALLRAAEDNVLGFDTESTLNGVAVVQLSSKLHSAVFQVSKIISKSSSHSLQTGVDYLIDATNAFPESLASLLEDSSFLKCGVGSRGK